MDDSMEKVMRPYFIVAFFIGCGIYKHPKGHLKLCLSTIYLCFVWTIYASSLNYMLLKFSGQPISRLLTVFTVYINLFLSMLSIFITFRKHEKYRMCIRRLDSVNDTLEELGIPKEYGTVRKSVKWSLVSWCLILCLANSLDALWHIQRYNNVAAAIIPIIMNYSLHINTLLDLIIVFMLKYIGTKFDKINEHIEQLTYTEDCGLRCTWKKSLIIGRYYIQSTDHRKRMLWAAIHLHLELCQISRNINALYGMQMTVQMASYFVIFLGLSYFNFRVLLHSTKENGVATLKCILSTDAWTIIFLSKLIILNHTCESVSAKAEKTKDVIHKLTNFIRFADMHEEIYQFGLQISLRPLKFSGMGLFYFGYNFIYSFVMWIFTVVLMLVQVEISPIIRVLTSERNMTSWL